MNSTTIIQALEIMGKGMAGIFVTIFIIMVCVLLMSKIGSRKKDDTEDKV